MAQTVNSVLRAVSSGLQTPTVIILLIIIALTIIMLGSLIAEFFTERRRMKTKMPQLIDELQGKSKEELWTTIEKSGLLKKQKSALKELIDREELPENTRVALAKRLIFEQQEHYEKIVKVTDVVSKVAPMFGLMGTLIPLAPGLIALGQGDVKTLSDSLLIAFDTTVAGLISGAVAITISTIRRGWYDNYDVAIETIMECVLECQESSKIELSVESKVEYEEVQECKEDLEIVEGSILKKEKQRA